MLRKAVTLTTVGFGMDNYNDVLMEQLADNGNGFYAYMDDMREARRLFVDELTSTLQTIAMDAKVQVDFNPEVVKRYRLVGFENRAIADEDFRDNTWMPARSAQGIPSPPCTRSSCIPKPMAGLQRSICAGRTPIHASVVEISKDFDSE